MRTIPSSISSSSRARLSRIRPELFAALDLVSRHLATGRIAAAIGQARAQRQRRMMRT
jgi:hypothetical protein